MQSCLSLPPLSLYVHIPWCVQKCPYCDFNSHASSAPLPEGDYVQALINDLKADKPLAQGRKLTSLFFGGGTPSLFSEKSIETIIAQAQKLIGFENNIEITLEANPGTFEQERFTGYRLAGVNRLSIGIQSFNDTHLKGLGRIHDGDAAKRAMDTARMAGFDNINIDLMHGLPNQSAASALNDLQSAIAFNPTHISWYQLTIEPNTAFYSAPPILPEEDTLADIQDAGQEVLSRAGFLQYEVSAYAKQSNNQAKHNLNYWQFGDYLGIGAGAHGKITQLKNKEIIRRWKTRQPNHYLKGATTPELSNPYTAGQETLSSRQLPLDFLMNALRLIDGCPSALFSARTGLDLEYIKPKWHKLQQQGLVESLSSNRIRTTPLGQRFLNDVLQHF